LVVYLRRRNARLAGEVQVYPNLAVNAKRRISATPGTEKEHG